MYLPKLKNKPKKMNSNQYKCLSILQPWASLCVHTDSNGKALKQIETRSWNTKYRGTLLIHASKKKFNTKKAIWHFLKLLSRTLGDEYLYKHMPYGAIIGKVDLDGVIRTEDVDVSEDKWKRSKLFHKEDAFNKLNCATISPQEYAFGDYSENRFCWLLSNPILFKEPIPCKGQLSIWNLPAELVPLVNRQIEMAL